MTMGNIEKNWKHRIMYNVVSYVSSA